MAAAAAARDVSGARAGSEGEEAGWSMVPQGGRRRSGDHKTGEGEREREREREKGGRG